MSYLLDILIVLLILASVFNGARRGIVQMVISFAGIIAAFLIASYVSNAADDYIYEKTVRPVIIGRLTEKTDEVIDEYNPYGIISETITEQEPAVSEEAAADMINGNSEGINNLLTNGEFHDKLIHVFNEYCRNLGASFKGVIPDDVIDESNVYLKENNPMPDDMLDFISFDSSKVSGMLEDNIIKPVFTDIVHTVIFIAVFIIVSMIFSIISKVTGIIRYIPGLNSINRLLGGILGTVYGLMWVIVSVLLLSIFIRLSGDGSSVINNGIVSQTRVFKHFYYAVLSYLGNIQI